MMRENDRLCIFKENEEELKELRKLLDHYVKENSELKEQI
jgi:hypothetical protein